MLGVLKKVSFELLSPSEQDDLDSELMALDSHTERESNTTAFCSITPDLDPTLVNISDCDNSRCTSSVRNAIKIICEELTSNGCLKEMETLALSIVMHDGYFDTAHQPKKRKRDSIKDNIAANIFSPCYDFSGNIEDAEWIETEDNVSPATSSNNASCLHTLLIATTRGNEKQAASAITSLLRDGRQKI